MAPPFAPLAEDFAGVALDRALAEVVPDRAEEAVLPADRPDDRGAAAVLAALPRAGGDWEGRATAAFDDLGMAKRLFGWGAGRA
jgi:hypothetical protein